MWRAHAGPLLQRELTMKMPRRDMLGMLTTASGSALVTKSVTAAPEQAPTHTAAPRGLPNERVTGIGGFFFRAHDPKALGQWYQEHLGVFVVPQSKDDQAWTQEAGATAFQPFPEKTTYFGDAAKTWMINFRVRDLDKMVAQLRDRGVGVDVDAQTYPNGRFARLSDPEGNPIQLWQPQAKERG
jgi:predicted enzyme related to lactoylglutathione lyase